jgi:glycosyltransferase involved in cell wall biosynthesis
MKTTIIIPCFNEKHTIEKLLNLIELHSVNNREVIVIDDCSTDGTTELLRGRLRGRIQQLIVHSRNLGKGAAIRSGINCAAGDIILIQDADLEYDPREHEKLIGPILDGSADVVYGSRFMGGHPRRVVYYWHRVGNALLTTLSNMMTNLNLTDMETCYKAFRREIIQSVEIQTHEAQCPHTSPGERRGH